MKNRYTGLSLIETVITMGLVGIVIIPMLLFSATAINKQIASARENITLSHNVGFMLNRLLTELSYATHIEPDSSSTKLKFAYYDPVIEEERFVEYRLQNNYTGQRCLYRNEWNVLGSAVTSQLYLTKDWTEIELTGAPEFLYDILDDRQGRFIGVSASSTIPPAIILSNFNFRDIAEPSRTISLTEFGLSNFPKGTPEEGIAIITGSNVNNGMLISQSYAATPPRVLREQTQLEAFGDSSVDLNTVALNPDNGNMLAIPTPVQNNSTIIMAADNLMYAGYTGILVDKLRDRYYFAEYQGPFNAKLFQWDAKTKSLLTILNNGNHPGDGKNFHLSEKSGRIFFSNGFKVQSWIPNILTTINCCNTQMAQNGNSAFSPKNGYYIYGTYKNTWRGGLRSWSTTSGYSTILLPDPGPVGYMFNNFIANDLTDHVFIAQKFDASLTPVGGPWTVRRYTATGMTTLLDDGYDGTSVLAIDRLSDGVVINSKDSIGGNNLVYHTGALSGGLTTLMYDSPEPFQASVLSNEYNRPTIIYGAEDQVYRWTPGDPSPTLLINQINHTLLKPEVDQHNKRVFLQMFNNNSITTWVWSKTNGATTITSSWQYGIIQDGMNSRTFLIEPTSGAAIFYTKSLAPFHSAWMLWQPNGTLTTLLSNNTSQSHVGGCVDHVKRRVAFSNKKNFYTWSSNDGLQSWYSTASGKDIDRMACNPHNGDVLAVETGVNAFTVWQPPASFTTNTAYASTPYGYVLDPIEMQFKHSLTAIGSTMDLKGNVYTLDNAGYITRFSSEGTDTIKAIATRAYVEKARIYVGVNCGDIALDTDTNTLYIADSCNNRVLRINGNISKMPDGTSPSTTLILDHNNLPATNTITSIAYSPRSRTLLICDSYVNSQQIRIYGWSLVSNSLQYNVSINVSDLKGVDGTGVNDYKIEYDDKNNLLYLLSPTLNRVFLLMFSRYV